MQIFTSHGNRCVITVLVAAIITASNATLAAGIWEQRAPMPIANSEFAVAEANGEMYIMGGYPASRESQRAVQIYNVSDDSWRMGPDLPLAINHSAAASLDGIIYLFGGQTTATSDPLKAGFVDTVYALDPRAGTWQPREPMPSSRGGAVAIVVGNKIYVAGGRPPHGEDFAVYDPAANTWEILPNLPSKSNHMAAAAIDGRVHVVGGRLGGSYRTPITAEHVIYDPENRVWVSGPPMPRPRSGINGTMAYGCFHVWGGEGAGEAHDAMFADHDVYNPVQKRWVSLPPMPFPVHGVTGAAFIDGMIFIPGGGDAVGGSSGTHLNQVYKPGLKCE